MPYSHSLIATAIWSLVAALLYFAVSRDRRGALIVAALVASHWVLGRQAPHEPDMPLGFDEPRIGLGLWRSLPATLIVELVMLWGGAWLYARATEPTRKAGSIVLWGLVALLSVAFVGATLGPVPSSITPLLATVPVIFTVVVGCAFVIEHYRRNRPVG